MTRPASLGGGGAARNHAATGCVEADFLGAYQEPASGQWLGRVKMEGGRVLENVRFAYPGSRPSVGGRPMMPAKGERGLIVFPASVRQTRLAYWIGSIDKYAFSINVEHPDDAQTLHPSGTAEITDRHGAVTQRFYNGDVIFQGIPDKGEGGVHFTRRTAERIVVPQTTGIDPSRLSQWKYLANNGRFFGGLLAHLQKKALGALALDLVKGLFQARYKDPDGDTFTQGKIGVFEQCTVTEGGAAWITMKAGGEIVIHCGKP